MEIEELIMSVNKAVQQTYSLGELNAMYGFLNGFFEMKEGQTDKTYMPKTISIALPSSDPDKKKLILMPAAALVHHNTMNIDYVKLNLNIKVEEENTDGLQITSQNINADANANEGKTGELEIMFRCTDTPEGIARIETQLNSVI